MRSREEEPDLLYVIKFLAAEEMPGLPPGGGITSKWVRVQADKQARKKTFSTSFDIIPLFFLCFQARLYHLCIPETRLHYQISGANGKMWRQVWLSIHTRKWSHQIKLHTVSHGCIIVTPYSFVYCFLSSDHFVFKTSQNKIFSIP